MTPSACSTFDVSGVLHQLTGCHRRRIGASPVLIGQDLGVYIGLAALLDALHLLKTKEAVIDRGVQGAVGRGRATDSAARCRQWRCRGKSVHVSTYEPGVQRHQTGRALLHDDGGLHLRWLWGGNWGHIQSSTTESIGGSHLVHVHHRLGRVDGLLSAPLLRSGVLCLSIPRHFGWLVGVVALLAGLCCRFRVVCERRLSLHRRCDCKCRVHCEEL